MSQERKLLDLYSVGKENTYQIQNICAFCLSTSHFRNLCLCLSVSLSFETGSWYFSPGCLLKNFLLTYYLFSWVSLSHFHMYLQRNLVTVTSSIILSYPSPPSSNNFKGFHCSIFIHVYRVHGPYSPSFTLFVQLLPLPLEPTSRQEQFYTPVLHF
jgi:hypothetical protein